MKKFWFKRKLYGWGWTPANWKGWVSTLFFAIFLAVIFSQIDQDSHSGSDTLIGFVFPMMALIIIFISFTWLVGERPRWQWGKRVEDLADVIFRDGIAVLATDTTYGIVGSAFSVKAVNEIYRLRKRDLNKPFIILISSKKDLKKFGVKPTAEQNKILHEVWPGPVSVVLSCGNDKFAYLHRGSGTLAFRCPADQKLRQLIKVTGPIVAPSANPQGHPVAKNISEARSYFGHHVDFYEDDGEVVILPSKIIDITDGSIKTLRP